MAQVLLELQVAPGQYQHMLVDDSLVDEWAESGWATPGNSVPQPASQSFSDTAVAALMTVATATRAAIDARVHAVGDTTYVRSVNGQTVDEVGNVVVTDTTTLATATAHADSGDTATLTTATGRAIAFAITLG